MPRRRRTKRTCPPSKATVAAAATTGIVGTAGTLFSMHYAKVAAGACTSALASTLSDYIAQAADYAKDVPSFQFWINATIPSVSLTLLTGQVIKTPEVPIAQPVETPTFVIKLMDIFGQSAFDSANSIVNSFAEFVGDDICYYEVLIHGLAVTLTLTGLAALLTYTCHRNSQLANKVEALEEDAIEQASELAALIKVLRDKGDLKEDDVGAIAKAKEEIQSEMRSGMVSLSLDV